MGIYFPWENSAGQYDLTSLLAAVPRRHSWCENGTCNNQASTTLIAPLYKALRDMSALFWSSVYRHSRWSKVWGSDKTMLFVANHIHMLPRLEWTGCQGVVVKHHSAEDAPGRFLNAHRCFGYVPNIDKPALHVVPRRESGLPGRFGCSA